MQCPNCGTDLKPGTKFCFNCGYYLEEESDDNSDTGLDNQEDTDTVLTDSNTEKSKLSTNDIDFSTDDFDEKKKKTCI